MDQMKEIERRTAQEVRRLVNKHNVRFFGVGGAIGYDTLAAKVLFRLRETEFPHIKIILVYPFETFTDRWTPTQKAEYKKLFPQYDKRVCMCSQSLTAAYLTRDRHLVEGSAYCICYCTRNFGGTAYTVKYAIQKGLQIRNVAPG